ncbi:MAG TPA: GNAT family N-acyltransferase [Dehalococcoidia bacterium]|nr:GNAT family N-acyltransferase [Dehalococcoidia bacterium]
MGPGNADGQASLESLIPDWIEGLKPALISEAATPEERQATYRLRYQAVTERGWADPADFPEGLEYDEFDDAAVHVCAWLDGKLLASTRVVFPQAYSLLPTEKTFGCRIEPAGKVIDIGRTVVARQLGGLGRDALIGVLLYCWQLGRRNDFTHCCGAFSAAMLRLYKQLSIEVTVIGEPVTYMGEQRYPMIFELQDRDQRLLRNLQQRLQRRTQPHT